MHKGENRKKRHQRGKQKSSPIKNVSFYNNSKRQLGDNVRERCDVIRLHVEKIKSGCQKKNVFEVI